MQFEITPEFLASQGLSPTFPERFWSKVDKNGPLPDQVKYPGMDNCWVWTACTDDYGYGELSNGGSFGGKKRAHIASWILHNGPIPNSLCVLHACDRPACCRESHLFLGTRDDNNKDSKRKGRRRAMKGQEHPNHKLTEQDVLRIRELFGTGQFTKAEIGLMFGVTDVSISYITNRTSWKHI